MADKSSNILFLQGGTVLQHDEQDHVHTLRNTDILIKGTSIADIGHGLVAPEGAKVINCADKIIAPGFIDTHRHLWQTQMKGRFPEHTFIDYMPAGNFQSESYTAEDIFWGQLGGALEAIDAGTTFVLDHMHGAKTSDHGNQGLLALKASGLRCVYAYAIPWFTFENWDDKECVPNEFDMPEWRFAQIEQWLKMPAIADGRISIGFGFDQYFLPAEILQKIFARVRKAGVKLITSHIGQLEAIGMHSPIKKLENAGLLAPDMVMSHANGLHPSDLKALGDHGIFISSTPDTETHMGLGWCTGLEPGVKGSVGTDTHACCNSSIVAQARTLLMISRQNKSLDVLKQGKFPKNLLGSSEQVFNMITVDGARAVGLGDQIGKIAKGYLADLNIIEAKSPAMLCASQVDPVAAVLRHSDVRDISTVIINGQIRKQDGRLLPVQLENGVRLSYEEVRRSILHSQEAILRRIDDLDLTKGREVLLGLLRVTENDFQDTDPRKKTSV